MAKRATVSGPGHLTRSIRWAGLTPGDAVVVGGVKELRQSWVFVAHVRNTRTDEEWVEVRGGRKGEFKSRAFRPEMIFAMASKKGGRVIGASLARAPQLQFD